MLEQLLENEFVLKQDDEITFGSNKEADDRRVGYIPSRKAFYLISKKDDFYIVVAVSLDTGNVIVSSVRNNVSQFMRTNAVYREINMLNAYKELNTVYNMLLTILMTKRTKIKQLNFLSRSKRIDRLLKRLFISGQFKMTMRRFNFVFVDEKENQTFVRYRFMKPSQIKQ